jgi:hypothetical protein
MNRPSCCAERLRGVYPTEGKQIPCWCGTIWTGRAGAWVSEGR